MEKNEELLRALIPSTYVKQGLQSLQSVGHALNDILTPPHRLPRFSLSEQIIEQILSQFSSMDSNNFQGKAGVGEREGRVFSALVARRHFGIAHGIGRSGDITEVQPKAAGSSIIYKLTNAMTKQALHLAGTRTSNIQCLVLPLATGMAISLTLMSLRNSLSSEQKLLKNKVIWSRIDQKSCFKAIFLAGLEVIVVDPIIDLSSGEMVSDVNTIGELLRTRDDIFCVLSTTSCFAPRQPDSIDEIAVLCKVNNTAHVINNAYGVQCASICKLLDRAILKGRVDAFIQSTDKNFLVPVGGSILVTTSQDVISAVSSAYPGRASMTPILDLFITFLSMGENGYRRLLDERKRISAILKTRLEEFSTRYGLRLLPSPRNTISYAVDLSSLDVSGGKGLSFLGSMLFQRNISGCRVVTCSARKTIISDVCFTNWGAHTSSFPKSYLTAACAIGMLEEEIDVFMNKLRKTIEKFKRLTSSTVNNSLVMEKLDTSQQVEEGNTESADD